MAATRAEFLLLDLIINATCRCHERAARGKQRRAGLTPSHDKHQYLAMLNPTVPRHISKRKNKKIRFLRKFELGGDSIQAAMDCIFYYLFRPSFCVKEPKRSYQNYFWHRQKRFEMRLPTTSSGKEKGKIHNEIFMAIKQCGVGFSIIIEKGSYQGEKGQGLAGEMYHKRKSTQLSGKDYDKRHDFFCCPLTPRQRQDRCPGREKVSTHAVVAEVSFVMEPE